LGLAFSSVPYWFAAARAPVEFLSRRRQLARRRHEFLSRLRVAQLLRGVVNNGVKQVLNPHVRAAELTVNLWSVHGSIFGVLKTGLGQRVCHCLRDDLCLVFLADAVRENSSGVLRVSSEVIRLHWPAPGANRDVR
jgi:hypothetical protein